MNLLRAVIDQLVEHFGPDRVFRVVLQNKAVADYLVFHPGDHEVIHEWGDGRYWAMHSIRVFPSPMTVIRDHLHEKYKEEESDA